jgi:precorrin-6A/cobalt-precorrin-6A reductase
MILLLGGTSELSAIAAALAEAGFAVLVSTATDEPLELAPHPNIERRSGRLDDSAMLALIAARSIRAIVDATHPYATAAHATADQAARQAGIPCIRFVREGGIGPQEGVHFAADHERAAALAFSFGRPVLLTTGANHLAPYARDATTTGLRLVARVLPRAESVEACHQAGIADENIVAARGPFSLEQNLQQIRRYGIGVLVTKDSGPAGGVEAKLEAARQEHCQVVVVARPAPPPQHSATTVEQLVRSVKAATESAPRDDATQRRGETENTRD